MITAWEALAARIRQARRAAGLSQQRIADAVGIPRTAVSDIESGQRNVYATELAPLADALGCTVAWLLDLSPEQGAGFYDGWRACAEVVTRATAQPTPPTGV